MEPTLSHTLDAQEGASSSEKRSVSWKLQRVEWAFVIGFWTFLAVLRGARGLLDGGDLQQGEALQRMLVAFSNYYFWALLTPGIFWLSRRYSIERAKWGPRALLHLAVALLVAMIAQIY